MSNIQIYNIHDTNSDSFEYCDVICHTYAANLINT